jgi:hypothetical protein
MALDETDHRLFVATRMPAQLAVFDTSSGRLVATLPTVQDSDDLYYDSARGRVYVPGGEGYISVYQQDDADHYKLLAKVQTAIGARSAGYFGKGRKGFDRFYLAAPSRADHGAEVYRIKQAKKRQRRRSLCESRFHNPQKRMAIDILQREIDQMGVRVDRNRVRMRHRKRAYGDEGLPVLTKDGHVSGFCRDTQLLESSIEREHVWVFSHWVPIRVSE